jgi:uncharacterized membrane protein
VEPITVSVHIDLPREQVFDYLADIANHPEFLDHWLIDWHMLRTETYGAGAGARFRIRAPLNRFSWGDLTLAELTPPFRILARGRSGKYNRIRMMAIYELHLAAGGGTRVELTWETVPVMPSDHLLEAIAGRRRTRRRLTHALRRLRAILERSEQRGAHAAIAAR